MASRDSSWGLIHFDIDENYFDDEYVCRCWFRDVPYIISEIVVPYGTHRHEMRRKLVQQLRNIVVSFKNYVCSFCDKPEGELAPRFVALRYYGDMDSSMMQQVCEGLYKDDFQENKFN